jgi:hypothetical protein
VPHFDSRSGVGVGVGGVVGWADAAETPNRVTAAVAAIAAMVFVAMEKR